MPFDQEFRHHLHQLMVEVSLGLLDEANEYKRKLVWEARQTHNAAAIPNAYSRAAIHAFRARVEKISTRYFEALNECGIRVDDAVEREILKLISALTTATHPLTFPPAIKGEHPVAVQHAYAMERARVGNQLYRVIANRLREMKIKAQQKPPALSSHSNIESTGGRQIMNTSENIDKVPRVFISYSWDSPEHRDWVAGLATDLRGKGIDVILDQWHLRHGDDKAAFMEQSVIASDFVLLVCTPEYAEKANGRHGGVGYEAMIITGQLAGSLDQNKFIPVLRLGTWESAPPVWLKTRFGPDLSGTPYSGAQFEDLLRTLHQQPVVAPPIGARPIFDDALPSIVQSRALSQHILLGKQSDVNLSAKEWELLGNAVKSKSGQIWHRKAIGAENLIVDGRPFIEPRNARSSAAYFGALRSLESKSLIAGVGSARDYFEVTDRGYGLADQRGDFVSWQTGQITLAAYYIGAEPDSKTLVCGRILELPEEYYPDQTGADGHVMRSVKEHRSLLVEGIDVEVVDALTWQINGVSFVDTLTRKKEEFRVQRVETSERQAIRLAVQN